MITYKGKLLNNKYLINGICEPGDILDAQIKINHNRSLDYVTHDKQNVLDLMYSVYSNQI